MNPVLSAYAIALSVLCFASPPSLQPSGVEESTKLIPQVRRPGLSRSGSSAVPATAPSFPYQVIHEFLLPPANPDAALMQATDGNFYGTTYNGGASNLGTVFKMDASGTVTTLHSFAGSDGANPYAALIQGSDGNFYGTTFKGGATDQGTVFKMDASGTVTTLHSFAGQPAGDGAYPIAGLIQGNDGNFYGTTEFGGTVGVGTVFKMTASGAVTTLHSFAGSNGTLPYAGLIQASDGYFYGTTYGGGANNDGTVFKIDSLGAVTTLHSFAGSDGAHPEAALIEGSDGNFYGTTVGLVFGAGGTVFKMDASGAVTTLHSFAAQPLDAANPVAALIQASDGNFYGTTARGGANDKGTVFKMDSSGTVASTVTILHSFAGQPEGRLLYAGLIQGSDGNFYGTTLNGGAADKGAVFKMNSSGAVTTLHSFAGQGANPYAALIQGSDANFYGTTQHGGANDVGTVFKMDASGAVTTLHSFTGSDGASPIAGVIQGSDGKFYGTTYQGGANNKGTVFKMDSSGTVITLHSFAGTGPIPPVDFDGANPYAELVQGSDGNFYGTTAQGGANNLGTVFKMDPLGAVTTLYSFAGQPSDGANPQAGLIQGSDGNFYGTTYFGGAANKGTVFKMDSSGTVTTLHSFADTNGANPTAALIEVSGGNFYGTTYFGGASNNGTVFKMDASGAVTTLHSFAGGDGANPHAAVIAGSDGNFYGTTAFGASVFRMDSSSTVTTLHAFAGSDGRWPYAGVIQGRDGNLYGTTQGGGASDAGTIFRINIALPVRITGIERLTSGAFQVTGAATPGATVTIQASPNLVASFVQIGTASADTNGAFAFQDVDAANLSQRFYRAVVSAW